MSEKKGSVAIMKAREIFNSFGAGSEQKHVAKSNKEFAATADAIEQKREMMTAKEVAKYLGIGINQLYLAAANDEVPAVKVGKRWLFNRRALLQWLGCKDLGTLEEK